ncbi:hypothetical protein BHM03_00053476 [Ensete ventricosum]|nr:hypothetical protein BHM03_00053476 [Ensete ventricosum]
MDSHDNTLEEATSARGTKSTADLEVTGYDTAYPMPINVAWRPRPMLLQPHILRTSRPYPERQQRIVIPETARGTKPTELRVEDR